MLLATQDLGAGSSATARTSPFSMVIVIEILVLAKALRMSGLASKILMQSMMVWVSRKWVTWENGRRLLAAIPLLTPMDNVATEEWWSENKDRKMRIRRSLGCDFESFSIAINFRKTLPF